MSARLRTGLLSLPYPDDLSVREPQRRHRLSPARHKSGGSAGVSGQPFYLPSNGCAKQRQMIVREGPNGKPATQQPSGLPSGANKDR